MNDDEIKQNFIEYLFNLTDKKNTNQNKLIDNTINKENMETFINNTDTILKKWIEHTNLEKGLTLYMTSMENNKEKDSHKGWLEGDHGFYLNSRNHIQLNEYLINKLKQINLNKGCFKLDKENNYQNIQNCNQELEKIQIKDIKDITKRIEFNYKIFEETNNFINKKKETIKQQESELQKIKDKLENEKNKFQAQIINIKNINDKIINYTSLIKKYMNSDYQSILNTQNDFILSNQIEHIYDILQKKEEVNSIEKDIIHLSKQFHS